MRLITQLFDKFKKNTVAATAAVLTNVSSTPSDTPDMSEEDVGDTPAVTPRWASVPTAEGHAEDRDRNIDFNNVVVYFKQGTICDVQPDCHNYYTTTHYNIDGKDYDISDIESVRSIPVPTEKNTEFCGGTPIYNLEYLIRYHAVEERKAGNFDLSYALVFKGTELMFYSNVPWQRHDYLRAYYWLLDDGKIKEAETYKKKLGHLPHYYSEKEKVKEIQHLNYALLKHSYPKDMPKSFNSYMKEFNANSDKFQRYKTLAKEIGIIL